MKRAMFYFSGLTFRVECAGVTRLYPGNKPMVSDAVQQYRPIAKSMDMKVAFCINHDATKKYASGLAVVTHSFRTNKKGGKKRREEKFYVSRFENGRISSRLIPFSLPQVHDSAAKIPGAPYNGEIVFVTESDGKVESITRIRDDVKLALNDFNAQIDSTIIDLNNSDPELELYNKINAFADERGISIACITLKEGKIESLQAENADGPLDNETCASIMKDLMKVIK